MTITDVTDVDTYRWEDDPTLAPRLRRAQADGATIRSGPEVEWNENGPYVIEVEFGSGYTLACLTLHPEAPFWQLELNTSMTTGRSGATRADHVTAAHQAILAAQLCLDLNKMKTARAVDMAVSNEVKTLLADRGWTFRQAAEATGIPLARFGNLVCGQTPWAVRDISAVAAATGQDAEDEFDRLIRIARAAQEAQAQ